MRILVADDDEGTRLVAQAMIEELGHECVLAADGDAAWQLVQASAVDVLVTDWMMPGINGPELCKRIRSATSGGQSSYTYIIVVTSLSKRDHILAGMEAGADDYIIKPLNAFELQTRLLAATRVTGLHTQLAASRDLLRQLSRTDALTQLGNRRSMEEELTATHVRCRRYSREYSVALVDVDLFKRYNDAHGHQAGDEALRRVAASLLSQAREGDGVFRYGGEEFLVVLPEQPLAGAVAAAERMRGAVETQKVGGAGPKRGPLTVSIGVASFVPEEDATVEDLVSRADAALYQAKQMGRNMVRPASLPSRDAARVRALLRRRTG